VSIEEEVDRLVDERPGRELLVPRYDDPAHRISDVLYRSGGTTASYCVLTGRSRVVVNTGLGYEAPHHKRVFDALCPGPTPWIVTTQGHVDHLGGVALFREPGTRYVAQERNQACQADDARIRGLRLRTAGLWFDTTGRDARRIAAAHPGVSLHQDTPVPDVTVGSRMDLEVDGLPIELHAAVGETTDSLIVWLPDHRTALVSNLLGPLFPHFPNLNTLRGDRYRMVEPYLQSIRTLRSLRPDMLVTGRHDPVVGSELIDAALARLHDAVAFVHERTLEGINAGEDVWTLVRRIELPRHLRVGQGYGTVAWGVRTIWETYVGWFKLLSSTELYPDQHTEAMSTLVEALGTEAVVDRARRALAEHRPVVAVHLAEAVLALEPAHGAAAAVMAGAHARLLADGGERNFWAHGWLEHERRRWEALAVAPSTGPPAGDGPAD